MYVERKLIGVIHSLPNFFKYPILGITRMICLLSGIKSGSVHHASAQALLGVGFYIEYLIVGTVFLNKNPEVRYTFKWHLVNALPYIIIIPLFYHQFVIFRNFTIPHSHEKEIERHFLRALRIACEFTIYIAFGLITGEAGYLYAIGSFHAPSSAVFQFIHSLLQTDKLDDALESLFVMGAALVCFLVLIWDVLIMLELYILGEKSDAKNYEIEFGCLRLIWWFIIADILSVALWCCIATVCSSIFAFTHYGQVQNTNDLETAIEILKILALLYGLVSLLRFVIGMSKIAKASSFKEISNSPL